MPEYVFDDRVIKWLRGVVDVVRQHDQEMNGVLAAFQVIADKLDDLKTTQDAQNARLTALEGAVERFLGDNSASASELDSEFSQDEPIEGEIVESQYEVDSNGIIEFVIINYTDPADLARQMLQEFYERRR